MRRLFDFWYDYMTGDIYDPEFNIQPFRFDAFTVRERNVNPMQFADPKTAVMAANFVRSLLKSPAKVSTFIDDMNAQQVRVEQFGDSTEPNILEMNAGLLVNSIMRSGIRSASQSVRAEMDRSGIA